MMSQTLDRLHAARVAHHFLAVEYWLDDVVLVVGLHQEVLLLSCKDIQAMVRKVNRDKAN